MNGCKETKSNHMLLKKYNVKGPNANVQSEMYTVSRSFSFSFSDPINVKMKENSKEGEKVRKVKFIVVINIFKFSNNNNNKEQIKKRSFMLTTLRQLTLFRCLRAMSAAISEL